MNEYREVLVEDSTAARESNLVTIFAVTIVALLAIGLLVWQPWSTAAVTPTHETTVVNPPAQPSQDRTVIVPGAAPAPAPAPSKTDITIKNENPAPAPAPAAGSMGSNESTDNGSGTTGSSDSSSSSDTSSTGQ